MRARDALLQRSDLPSGGRERPAPLPRIACRSGDPFRGATALAWSPRIEVDEELAVQERVGLYPTDTAAARAFARLAAPASRACFRRQARLLAGEQARGTASPLEVVRTDERGSLERATRYTTEVNGALAPLRGYIDVVQARAGRGLAALVIVSSTTPVSEELYEQLVATLSRRLRDALS